MHFWLTLSAFANDIIAQNSNKSIPTIVTLLLAMTFTSYTKKKTGSWMN